MRTKLKETREKCGLDQKQMAERLAARGYGVRRQTISEWETGKKTIRTCFIEPIRDILDCRDQDLFDIDKPDTIWDYIAMLRRQFLEKFGAALSLAPLFQNITVALVTTPHVEPDEYLSLCRSSIDSWWGQMRQYTDNSSLEVNLHKAIPVLSRLATSVHPFQIEAARLAVEANIIYKSLLGRKMLLTEIELTCKTNIQYASITSDNNLIALTHYWLGDHYTYDCSEPVTALQHLNDALHTVSNGDGNPLLKSAIYSDLSIAHAQDKDPLHIRENERCSLNYIQKARDTFPSHPLLNTYHRFTGVGESELDQFEGRAFLFLSELTQNSQYALKAHAQFEKALALTSTSIWYRIQALTRLGDAARVLNEKSHCVDCLTLAYQDARSLHRLTQIHDVLDRTPHSWKTDREVRELLGAVTNSIVQIR